MSEPQSYTTPSAAAKVQLRKAWFAAHPNQPAPEGRVEVDVLLDAIEAEARAAGEAAIDVDAEYTRRVEQMAIALHTDCALEWQAVAVADPTRQITMHGWDAHYGNAHDLVRRVFPELDRARLAPERDTTGGAET